MMACWVLNESLTGEPPARTGNGRTFVGAYGCYDAADARLMIGRPPGGRTPACGERSDGTISHGKWKACASMTCASAGRGTRPPWPGSSAPRTADEWEELFNEAGVPAARVRTLDEALASEQVASRPVLGEYASAHMPEARPRTAVAGFGCSADGPALRRGPPELGQHTAEILADLGYGPEDFAALEREGVV